MKNIFRELKIIKLRLAIRWKYRKPFSMLGKTISLGEKIFTSPPVIWNEEDDFSKIIIIFLAQNIHRLRSIQILCQRGFAKDGVGLLRTMFENLVDFKYLYQNKSEIQNFIEYDSYLRLKLGRAIIRGKLKNVDLKRVKARNKELEGEYEKVRHKFTYIDKNSKERKFYRWNGTGGLQKLSKTVGLERNYDSIYGFFSDFVHGSISTANYYVLGKDKKGVVVEIGTSQDFIGEAIYTATGYFIDMLSIVNSEYKMDFKYDLEKITKLIRKKAESKNKH